MSGIRFARKAVAFDTGADCDDMLEAIEAHGLKLELILLTHSHGDHILELDRLRERTSAEAWIGEKESIAGAPIVCGGKERFRSALSPLRVDRHGAIHRAA